MTQIAKTRDTKSPTGELEPKYIYEAIALLMPEEATFMAFLANINKDKTVTAPTFYFYSVGTAKRWTAINLVAGYLSTDTALVVDNEEYGRAGDIVFVPRTGERMRISSITTATSTWTVTRSIGGTAAQALVNDDSLLIIGNSNEEGAPARPVKTEKETEYKNWLQIHRTPFGVTNTQDKSKQLSGNDLTRLRKEEMITHRKDLERIIIFGEQSEITTGTHPERTTSGIIEYLTKYCANWRDCGAIPTEDEFENFCEQVFKYGKKKKLFLCSRSWITEMNRWGRHKLQMNTKDKEYGIAIATYISAHGELKLIPADSLEGSVYGYYGIVIDPSEIEMVHLTDRKIVHNKDIQLPGADEKQEEYLSEFGLKMTNFDAHGVVYYNQ